MAALCYAEFAAMAPVAGSAYTYAYATLGEIFAWIIGWDLILEYAMGCAVVASAWTKYFNTLLTVLKIPPVPDYLSKDPFNGGWLNLPSVIVMAAITCILVLGIRESARTNAVLVAIKLSVVLFVIAAGIGMVHPANWTSVPVWQRAYPEDLKLIPGEAKDYSDAVKVLQHAGEVYPGLVPAGAKRKIDELAASKKLSDQLKNASIAEYHLRRRTQEIEDMRADGKLAAADAKTELDELSNFVQPLLPKTAEEKSAVDDILAQLNAKKSEEAAAASWGILGVFGLNRWLIPLDEAVRGPFMPYGISGIMLGAAIVFFAFIGFDSISTQAEEAKRPQRDLPLGILLSLAVCTLLYIAVSAVVTGMVAYPRIDTDAPIAAVFKPQPGQLDTTWLKFSRGLIAAGGLAGMTSVLLVLFLSQARIFMAMSRDGLLPKIFSTVHSKFRTPHVATILTGIVICFTAALTPIDVLEEMVNVGTLMAFAMVCAAVWVLALPAAGRRAPLPLPGDLARRSGRNSDQHRDDALSVGGHMDSFDCLAGNRTGHLLCVQQSPQPHFRTPAARDRHAAQGNHGDEV